MLWKFDPGYFYIFFYHKQISHHQSLKISSIINLPLIINVIRVVISHHCCLAVYPFWEGLRELMQQKIKSWSPEGVWQLDATPPTSVTLLVPKQY